MVGLSDVPCVGKIVNRISDATVEAFFRGLRYLFCYKELVHVLNSEMEKVNIQQGRMSTKSVEERANGKIIEDHVLRWQTEVLEIQETAKEFTEKYNVRASWTCFKCLPVPNPVSRFRLGREAVLKAKRATELVDSGKELLAYEIAYLPPIENSPKAYGAFQDFPSRKYVYGMIWEALITESSSLILGIYGMPGVGKTRMVEQIWQEAREKKIFKKVARAHVGSEKLDIITLQNQIAGHLNCHFESQENVERRASQLKNSLTNGGKILIILDDIWSEIPLEDIIGTSFGESSSSRGSKILLTSRKVDVCLRNKCEHPVQLKTLTVEEAWDLFQNSVGTCHIDFLQDETLVKEVCTKCAGLPLLIRAVGKTLQFMSHCIWKDALHKLEKGNFKNIAGIDTQVYACIKLSIDRLPDDAKICLFLCSLFREDALIDISMLIQFAIGSQLIPDGESTIPAMVDILTRSSLLLECYENGKTKLHDIIRDVARSIAFTDPKYAFLHIRCGARLPDNAGYSTLKLLRLDVESDNARFPKDLICTELSTLWLHCNNHLQQFSGVFFDMFVNLGCLILQNVHFHSKDFSLQALGKLNMLVFDNCDMRETDVSLFPNNLRTLCIWGCDLPSPLDLPNLENLQKLDIQLDIPEVLVVPNAISSLPSLEELHIPNGFIFSDDAGDVTAILNEICKLSRLTSLKISFSHFEPCHGTAIFSKLRKYDISVGRQRSCQAVPVSTRVIELIDVKVRSDEGFQSLMERAEELTLKSTDVNVSSISNSKREAFADLRKLRTDSCDTMEYVAKISEDKIQCSRQPRTSFLKLTILHIENCSVMKYLFCKSVAKCLVQLQELYVDNCPAMEVIVTNEGTSDGETINFLKLKKLWLIDLESLTSFYSERKEMHSGLMDNNSVISCAQFQRLFEGMVEFPSLVNFKLDTCGEINLEAIKLGRDDGTCQLKSLYIFSKNHMQLPCKWKLHLHNLQSLRLYGCWWHELKSLCFPKLKKLHAVNCGRSALFTISGFRSLQQLERLEIRGCDLLEETLEDARGDEHAGMHTEAITLLQLNSVVFKDLPNLKSFLSGANFECYMLALKNVEVDNCGLPSIFTHSVFRNLQQLETLVVSNCRLLEGIVENEREEETSDTNDKVITLFQLSSVTLKDLPNLRSFSRSVSYALNLPKLNIFRVLGCPLLETFTCMKTSTGLVSVYSEGHEGEEVTDLNDFIIQNRRRGSSLVKVLENQVCI